MLDTAIDPLAACIDAIYGVANAPAAARIEEAACIGCTLCIQACPVDAIVGASGQMHTVAAAWCTGCELCLPPCPVDCIHILPLLEQVEGLDVAAERARQRYALHLQRRGREQRERAGRVAARSAVRQASAVAQTRQALIAAAVARARKINAR